MGCPSTGRYYQCIGIYLNRRWKWPDLKPFWRHDDKNQIDSKSPAVKQWQELSWEQKAILHVFFWLVNGNTVLPLRPGWSSQGSTITRQDSTKLCSTSTFRSLLRNVRLERLRDFCYTESVPREVPWFCGASEVHGGGYPPPLVGKRLREFGRQHFMLVQNDPAQTCQHIQRWIYQSTST